VELGGLTLPERVPLLADHAEAVRAVVGQGRASVRGGALWIDGALLLVTAAAKELHALAVAGFEWAASVGLEARESEYVRAGTKRRVNGRSLKSETDFTHVTKSILREVSLLATGADSQTKVRIAAAGRTGADGETDMDGVKQVETKPDKDLVGAERQRIASIEAAADAAKEGAPGQAGKLDAIAHSAITGGWDVAKAEVELVRAGRPDPPKISGGSRDADLDEHVLGAAVLLACGQRSMAEKGFGAATAQRAEDLRCRSLVDVAARALELDGRRVPASSGQLVQAAFSTVSLPIALGEAATKLVLDGYEAGEATWRSFCKVVPVPNYLPARTIRPSFLGELGEVAPGGAVEHGFLEEEAGTVTAKLYAQILGIAAQAIKNDSGGVFLDTARELGKNASRIVNDIVYGAILGDDGSFFSTDNANLLEGAGSALSMSSLGTAVAAMMSQRDPGGRDIDIKPRTLLVGPTLRQTALELTRSDAVQRYVSESVDRAPMGNALKDIVPVVEPRLENTTKFAGASTTAWYLMAGPADAPVVVAFVDGVESPFIETWQPGDQPDYFAFTWRVSVSVGGALCDYRAALKADGA